ncbi:hypothetical protein [uncultured Eubacterium sp.]|uniref:hypothetical protein n=1 Tax=uncultured Eubacterium sp. TaxID=165185 RepID=UPI0026348234|nr:hypothetical protein [uncultured Eubacterium sp.]
MKRIKPMMTILSIYVTIIIVGVIFIFKDNSRLVIDSEMTVSDNVPIIHITGKNTTFHDYYLTVSGVEYNDKYSCESQIYEMKRYNDFEFYVLPSYRYDDIQHYNYCKYTVHIYKMKNNKLNQLYSKTFTNDKNRSILI